MIKENYENADENEESQKVKKQEVPGKMNLNTQPEMQPTQRGVPNVVDENMSSMSNMMPSGPQGSVYESFEPLPSNY